MFEIHCNVKHGEWYFLLFVIYKGDVDRLILIINLTGSLEARANSCLNIVVNYPFISGNKSKIVFLSTGYWDRLC